MIVYLLEVDPVGAETSPMIVNLLEGIQNITHDSVLIRRDPVGAETSPMIVYLLEGIQ